MDTLSLPWRRHVSINYRMLNKPGNEWSVKEVLDHLIYATARVVIEPIRDLGAEKAPRPFTPDDSGGRALQSIQEFRQAPSTWRRRLESCLNCGSIGSCIRDGRTC